MKCLHIMPGGRLHGNLTIPGDKSITHRAFILGAVAQAGSKIVVQNWLPSLDCLATVQALQDMGVDFVTLPDGSMRIASVGLNGLKNPGKILDVGNSGTSMRLLTGLLAAQKFSSVITGDASLRKRPMQRIINPLTQMGAKITAINAENAPLTIIGGQKLQGIKYAMPTASAQVKSAIILAGLYAVGETSVIEPNVCRDHTEILLQYLKQQPESSKQIILNIPGDLSAAGFFIVGASIVPNSEITLCNVGTNPTRTGIIEILRMMGADISVNNNHIVNGELRADLHIRYTRKLQAIKAPQELIANTIDELPALCLAAACAHGTTEIRGAEELRYKESDRIALLAQGFKRLGIQVNEFSDGLAITGGLISGGEVATGGDHRIAMTFAMAGLVAKREIIVQDTANIATSFPNFVQVAIDAGMHIAEEQLCPI